VPARRCEFSPLGWNCQVYSRNFPGHNFCLRKSKKCARGSGASAAGRFLKSKRQRKDKCSVVRTFFCPAECYGAAIKDATKQLNFIGPQVRKFREAKGWTQENLAVKVQLFGWDASRLSVTRLENQERRVPDVELFVFASVLGVSADDLFPPNLRKKIKTLWPQYRVKLSRGQVPPKQ